MNDLQNFVAESEERRYLQSWIEWWHKRWNYIFHTFVQFESAAKMNHVELIYASWVKSDRMNISLLDGAYADSQDSILDSNLKQHIKMRQGRVEQAHLFKKNNIKLQEIRSVENLI